MGPDVFQHSVRDLLAAAAVDPAPLLFVLVLSATAVIVAVVALVVARRSTRVLRALHPDAAADPRAEARKDYARMLRRYSELLGVELVTGRGVVRGDSAIDVRIQLEESLHTFREPGAVELLDEVGDARAGLTELSHGQLAAANGLAAIGVEWSIDRWVADPRKWLADCREQARLEQLGRRSRERAHAS
jgi:hypothetical protein